MDISRIKESPVGMLVPIHGFDARTDVEYDHFAFVPDRLPDPREVTLNTETWSSIAKAEAALGRLDEAGAQVPEPSLLRQPALRREAQSTSALEGTFAPLESVLESEIEGRELLGGAITEILNYVAAAEYAFDWVAERPVSGSMIGETQRILVRATPGELSDSGGVRDRQVMIGSPTGLITEARYVPPPPGDILQAGFDSLIDWVATASSPLPPVLKTAFAHYQFESLHPFSDGNGRLGRLLIVLQFMREKVLREPLLVVSPWFESRRTEYQDAMLRVSQTGEWEPWIVFFANGVTQSADATRVRIEGLIEWREHALTTARESGLTGTAERIAGELIGAPFQRARNVSDRHQISQQAAMKALRKLVDLGLLEEQHRGRHRIFAAREVIELLGA